MSNRHNVYFLLLYITFLAFHSSAIEVSVLLGHCAMSVGSWTAVTHLHDAMSQMSGDLVLFLQLSLTWISMVLILKYYAATGDLNSKNVVICKCKYFI